MDLSFTSVIVAGAFVLLTIFYYWIRNKDVVPGPTGFPYLGLYPVLTDENAHLMFEEYKKKYGDIFSFTYTGRLFINLGSIKSMREVLINKSDCFADKFKDTNILTVMLRNGVSFVNGEPWKVLRKFFIQKFKEYGLNAVKDNMAGPVYDSLNNTIEELRNFKGKPINIVEFLGQRCAVTIRKIIFGEKGVTDEELGKILFAYTEALEGNLGVNLLLIGPLARFLFTFKPSFRKNLQKHQLMSKLVLESAKRIENSMNMDHPTNIIEEFFFERNRRRSNNDPTWKMFSDEALVDSILPFVGDGIQAVSAFIAGILNALVEYPDEQEKMFAEIHEIVGSNRQPTAEDKINLPYTNAFINEYLRTLNLVKYFPSLECTKETSLRGCRVPVGSILLLNFHSAHQDPETFEDPEIFNPSRYIISPGKPKAEFPVLFSMGKRSCSGEAFVMLQAFLFLTTIVKNFRVVASTAPTKHFSESFLMNLELTFVPRTEN